MWALVVQCRCENGPPRVLSISEMLLSIFQQPACLLTGHSLYFKLSPLPNSTSPSVSTTQNLQFLPSMSTGRSRTSRRFSDDDINDLVLKLQALVTHSNQRHTSTGASAGRILKETCSYIKRLQKEVDDLSERLSQLLDNINGVEAEQLRSLLQQ